jgi:hypothetical protein
MNLTLRYGECRYLLSECIAEKLDVAYDPSGDVVKWAFVPLGAKLVGDGRHQEQRPHPRRGRRRAGRRHRAPGRQVCGLLVGDRLAGEADRALRTRDRDRLEVTEVDLTALAVLVVVVLLVCVLAFVGGEG